LDYRMLQNQIRELHRLLGKKSLKAKILKEALDAAAGPKNVWLAPTARDFLPAFQSAPTYPVSGPDDRPRPRWSLRAYRSP